MISQGSSNSRGMGPRVLEFTTLELRSSGILQPSLSPRCQPQSPAALDDWSRDHISPRLLSPHKIGRGQELHRHAAKAKGTSAGRAGRVAAGSGVSPADSGAAEDSHHDLAGSPTERCSDKLKGDADWPRLCRALTPTRRRAANKDEGGGQQGKQGKDEVTCDDGSDLQGGKEGEGECQREAGKVRRNGKTQGEDGIQGATEQCNEELPPSRVRGSAPVHGAHNDGSGPAALISPRRTMLRGDSIERGEHTSSLSDYRELQQCGSAGKDSLSIVRGSPCPRLRAVSPPSPMRLHMRELQEDLWEEVEEDGRQGEVERAKRGEGGKGGTWQEEKAGQGEVAERARPQGSRTRWQVMKAGRGDGRDGTKLQEDILGKEEAGRREGSEGKQARGSRRSLRPTQSGAACAQSSPRLGEAGAEMAPAKAAAGDSQAAESSQGARSHSMPLRLHMSPVSRQNKVSLLPISIVLRDLRLLSGQVSPIGRVPISPRKDVRVPQDESQLHVSEAAAAGAAFHPAMTFEEALFLMKDGVGPTRLGQEVPIDTDNISSASTSPSFKIRDPYDSCLKWECLRQETVSSDSEEQQHHVKALTAERLTCPADGSGTASHGYESAQAPECKRAGLPCKARPGLNNERLIPLVMSALRRQKSSPTVRTAPQMSARRSSSWPHSGAHRGRQGFESQDKSKVVTSLRLRCGAPSLTERGRCYVDVNVPFRIRPAKFKRILVAGDAEPVPS